MSRINTGRKRVLGHAAVVSCLLLAFATAAKAEVKTKFSGPVGSLQQVGKRLVACVANGKDIYVADAEPDQWRRIYAGKGGLRVCGGDDQTVVFVETTVAVAGVWKDSYELKACSAGDKPETRSLGPVASPIVEFPTKDIGAVAQGVDIRVTFDAAAHWHPIALPFRKDKPAAVRSLRWSSDRILLAGDEAGRIASLTVDPKADSQLNWTQPSLAGPVVYILAVGPSIWAESNDLTILDAKTGHLDKTLHPQMTHDGFMVNGDTAYLYGYDGIEVWKATEKTSRQLKLGPVLGMLTQGKTVVVATGDNTLSSLDAESGGLKPLPSKVDPGVFEEAGLDAETKQVMAELSQLISKVPADQRQRIFEQANGMKDLSPIDRTRWVVKEFRRIAEQQDSNKPQP